MNDAMTKVRSIDVLVEFSKNVLEAAGASGSDARLIAEVLVDAEARGVPSQGLLRLGAYVAWARSRDLGSHVEWSETGLTAIARADARNVWPYRAMHDAVERAVTGATSNGVGLVLVSNIGHIGRLGYWSDLVAAEGCVGFVVTGGNLGSGWVAPWGGTSPLWGTNPLAFSFPRPDAAAITVDISTTQTSRGDVLLAQEAGVPLPDGVAIDAQGRSTTDPDQALPPRGTLAPLGAPVAGHKGYGLALAIQILCSAVTLNATDGDAGAVVAAISLGAERERHEYDTRLESLLTAVRSSQPDDGKEVRLPGERSARARQAADADGISLSDQRVETLNQLAQELGTPGL